MHQALVLELDLLANALAIKAREQRRRTGAIETFVVVKDLDPHRPLSQLIPVAPAKLFSIAERSEKHHANRVHYGDAGILDP